NEAPVFQQPVGFRAAVTQILSRQLVEFPLHIERADSLAILEMDNPLVAGSREMSRVLRTASASTRFRGREPSSSSDKTQRVVPIFSAVANGLMLESPMSK